MSVDFLNAALDAVVSTLAASTIFMATGTGTITKVERRSLMKFTAIFDQDLPYAGICLSEDGELESESSLGSTEVGMDVLVWLYGRGADSAALEASLLKAKAALLRIVDTEVRADRFGGTVGNARYKGGPQVDTEEASANFGLLCTAQLELWVPRPPTG